MAEQLTLDTFKDKVFDFEAHKDEWVFEGDKPAVIDFYADWCGPCKMVAPIIEELSTEYEGKVDFYKIDTDAEQQLSMMFGIQSIPSLLFIPKEGKPQMAAGAMPKDALINVIEKELL
jgi:thioredoxin 1